MEKQHYICANEIQEDMAVGQLVKVSPVLTGLQDWTTGRIIKIRQNPFMGLEIAAQDSSNAIYFGEAKYFKLA